MVKGGAGYRCNNEKKFLLTCEGGIVTIICPGLEMMQVEMPQSGVFFKIKILI